MINIHRLCALSLAALIASACSSAGLKHRLGESAVAAIPPPAQEELKPKSAAYEERETEKDKAKRGLRDARFLLANARSDQDLAERRRFAARELRMLAVSEVDETRVGEMEKIEEGLGLLVEAAQSLVEWRKRTLEQAEIDLRRADAKLLVAEAEREVARADALVAAKSPLVTDEQRTELKVQVSEHAEAAAALESDSAKAAQAVDEAKQGYEQALAKVPDSILGDKRALQQMEAEKSRLQSELAAAKAELEKAKGGSAPAEGTAPTP